jgi:error-prone DNA polymerase
VRIGLGYVQGVRRAEIEALVNARERTGPFRSIGDLASRAGAGQSSLEQLAWSGSCDALAGGDRRAALWQLGISAPGHVVPGGTQLSLPLDVPAPPPLRRLGAWETMLADYTTTLLTTRCHPLELLRDHLPKGTVASDALPVLRHGSPIRIAGLVVARQRPGTAKGIVFILMEDEAGTINLIVPPDVYERHRLIVRTEPLLLAEGTLERHPAAGGAINILVNRLQSLDAPDRQQAEVRELVPAGPPAPAEGAEEDRARGEDFRAVAPPVLSFAAGRRR